MVNFLQKYASNQYLLFITPSCFNKDGWKADVLQDRIFYAMALGVFILLLTSQFTVLLIIVVHCTPLLEYWTHDPNYMFMNYITVPMRQYYSGTKIPF